MTPEEVLRAATVTPARMMGIEDLVGTVEVGKRADLNVALADPLESSCPKTLNALIILEKRAQRVALNRRFGYPLCS